MPAEQNRCAAPARRCGRPVAFAHGLPQLGKHRLGGCQEAIHMVRLPGHGRGNPAPEHAEAYPTAPPLDSTLRGEGHFGILLHDALRDAGSTWEEGLLVVDAFERGEDVLHVVAGDAVQVKVGGVEFGH